MVDKIGRGHDAQRLRDDTSFQAFVAEVRNDQLMAFANSGADDVATREEAHAILRALSKIEGKLDSAIYDKNKDDRNKGTAP